MLANVKLLFWWDNWNSKLSFESFIDGDAENLPSDFWVGDRWEFDAILPIFGLGLTQYTSENVPNSLQTRMKSYGSSHRIVTSLSNQFGTLFVAVGLFVGWLRLFADLVCRRNRRPLCGNC